MSSQDKKEANEINSSLFSKEQESKIVYITSKLIEKGIKIRIDELLFDIDKTGNDQKVILDLLAVSLDSEDVILRGEQAFLKLEDVIKHLLEYMNVLDSQSLLDVRMFDNLSLIFFGDKRKDLVAPEKETSLKKLEE